MATWMTGAGNNDTEGGVVREAGGGFSVIISVGGAFATDVSGRFEDFLVALLVNLPFLVRVPRLGDIESRSRFYTEKDRERYSG